VVVAGQRRQGLISGKIGRGGFTFLQWRQGLAIMIWHDLGSASTHGSGATGDPIYRLSGYASSPDGRRVEWKAQTRDGKTAQFWIDSVDYDLANGKVFIVTTTSGVTNVRQLDRDLSGVQADYGSCVAFARGDPDLARFVDSLSDSQTEVQMTGLVDRARQDLQAQQGVRTEDISVVNIQDLGPLCHDPSVCVSDRPGYVIHLMVDGRVYEYWARVLGKASILWCETEHEPTTPLLHETVNGLARYG
jgi:hypothetical protein